MIIGPEKGFLWPHWYISEYSLNVSFWYGYPGLHGSGYFRLCVGGHPAGAPKQGSLLFLNCKCPYLCKTKGAFG